MTDDFMEDDRKQPSIQEREFERVKELNIENWTITDPK